MTADPAPGGPVRRVLFVELLGGFGDVLLALPAIHALARRHAEAAVDVLTFTPGDALLRGDPLVHAVMGVDDHAEGAARHAVQAALGAATYDLVVTTTTYDGIAELCAAAAPRVVTNLWRHPPPDERVDRRFLRLLVEDGLIDPRDVDLPLRMHLDPAERDRGRSALAEVSRGLPAGGPVVLVPGSGMRVKRWPADRWAEVAAACRAAARPALLVGGPDVPPVPGAVALPRSELRALAALFAAVGEAAGVVVGGDTGAVRLATAVGARAVGLYGPTLASRYGLDPAVGANVQGLPECTVRRPLAITEQECWWSGRCPLTGADPACMADIPVRTVWEMVQALDERRTSST